MKFWSVAPCALSTGEITTSNHQSPCDTPNRDWQINKGIGMCHNRKQDWDVPQCDRWVSGPSAWNSWNGRDFDQIAFFVSYTSLVQYCYQVLTFLCEYSGESGCIQYFMLLLLLNIIIESSYEEWPPYAVEVWFSLLQPQSSQCSGTRVV